MDATQASLEDLIAKLFIARPDVKAEQQPGGEYFTHAWFDPGDRARKNPHYIPWSRKELSAHLAGSATYGHYLLNPDNNCKLFAFDLDLDDHGHLPTLDMLKVQDDADAQDWHASFEMSNPRAAWRDRAHPARAYIKSEFMAAATRLSREIAKLGLPTLTAYSGNKGIHVYGFTGIMEAKLVREAAFLVLNALGCEAIKGDIFFKFPSRMNEPNDLMTIEVFPKQDELDDGRFGNLMRLPLGKNTKSPDPTFFMDTFDDGVPRSFTPHPDPRAALAKVLTELQHAHLA
jgi:hypothetical protein